MENIYLDWWKRIGAKKDLRETKFFLGFPIEELLLADTFCLQEDK